MHQHHSTTGLDEALASYQPTTIDPATWQRFREDALGLVRQLGRTTNATTSLLSRLVGYLAAVAPDEPEATLLDLLTPERVEGYLERLKANGENVGTLENRQGSLNTLLRVAAGAPDLSRPPDHERRLPHDRAAILAAVDRAASHGSPDGQAFARLLLAGLVGGTSPTVDGPVLVQVHGAQVAVADHTATVPAGVVLPATGTLTKAAADRGRRWACDHIGFVLDIRRLELAFVTHVVGTQPAVEALALPGVGRRRLDVAVDSAAPVAPAQYAAMLRGVS